MQSTQLDKELRLKEMKRRIIEISYKHKLCHLGSCLTALPILDGIFSIKEPKDKVILSCGHAGVALYVALEKHYGINADMLFEKHGVHPNRDPENHIDCSAGSLGHGIGISVGIALADRSRKVYCLISDGECAEGSVWEALNVKKEYKVDNLIIYANLNGWSAYKAVDTWDLSNGLEEFGVIPIFTSVEQLPCLKAQEAHYRVMSEKDYREAMEILK